MYIKTAAQRLGITQQSLSGHVKHLEEEYGVSLFERRPLLRLTAEGESMVFYARLITQAQSSMCNEFADLSTEHLASLSIGMSSMRSGLIGGGIWRRFHDLHPNVGVRIVENNTNALLQELNLGEIRIMVGVDIRQMPGLHVLPVLKEHLCFVVKKELYHRYYPDEKEKETGSEIPVSRVDKLPLLIEAKGTRLRTTLDRMYRQAGYMPKTLLESGSQHMLYQLVRQGEGAAILGPMVFLDGGGKFILPGDCYVFRLRETQASVVGIAYPADIQLTRYENAMVRIIHEEYLRYGESIARFGLRG